MSSILIPISYQDIWPIYRVNQIREIEEKVISELGADRLMQRAGAAVAQYIESNKNKTEPAPASKSEIKRPKIIFLVGPGNNGADALEAIHHLSPINWRCHVVLPMLAANYSKNSTKENKKDSVKFDGKNNQSLLDNNAINLIEMFSLASNNNLLQHPNLPKSIATLLKPIISRIDQISTGVNEAILADADIIVDGLFGIGLKRRFNEVFRALIEKINSNSSRQTVIALDIPSGLLADTGQSIDNNPIIRADVTLTFIALKPGLFTGKGRDFAGNIILAPLELPTGLSTYSKVSTRSANKFLDANQLLAIKKKTIWLNSPALFIETIPKRLASAHKGCFGTLAIIGGNQSMSGAAILAARAALLSGAGRVHTLLLANQSAAYDTLYPEIMITFGNQPSLDILEKCRASAYVIGPGLSRNELASQWLHLLLSETKPVVIDADGLIMLKKAEHKCASILNARGNNRNWILTPHPGEAAHMLDCSIAEIEGDRLLAATRLAERWKATIVLKGSGTIIARVVADGNNHGNDQEKYLKNDAGKLQYVINPTGNVGLASGGSGDTLAGIIGSLLAQGLPVFEAALAAVFWHGQAAENLAAKGIGPIGLTASELPAEIRRIRNHISL